MSCVSQEMLEELRLDMMMEAKEAEMQEFHLRSDYDAVIELVYDDAYEALRQLKLQLAIVNGYGWDISLQELMDEVE